MRTLVLLIPVLIVVQFSFGQNVTTDKGDKESFIRLPQGPIRDEVASFNSSSSLTTPPTDIHKKELNEIPRASCTDSAATFSMGDIIIAVYSTKFDAKKHKLSYSDPEQSFLTLIDNKPFWGTDGGIPTQKIKAVRFVQGKIQIYLPDSAVAGLYQPNFCNKDRVIYCKAFRSKDGKRIYIYMQNSDGAGGYEGTWVIQDNKYHSRILDYGF